MTGLVSSLPLATLAGVTVAVVFAIGFVATARWLLALVAAAGAAVTIGVDGSLLGFVTAGALATGLATGLSPAWRRTEQLAARRHSDMLPEPHRRQLASASVWYPGRLAATALVLVFPAITVILCFLVVRWSLGRFG